jgi:homoserine dehydrogenase
VPAPVYDEPRIRPLDEVQSRYYVRLVAADRPGVIASIAQIFGQHDISLSSVIQKEDVPVDDEHGRREQRHAEIVFMTHQAHEAAMQQARAEIARLPAVARIGTVIRVEA